jgi:hypothetical protein
MTREIGLVAAPRRQRGGICRAADQFDPSPVFRRARDYCARGYAEWYILAPDHPLLPPRQVIGPAACPLHELPAEARVRWVEELGRRLRERCERSAEQVRFVLFASQRTAELVMRAAPFAEIALPLNGLGFGARLRWYDERLRIASRVLAEHVAYG